MFYDVEYVLRHSPGPCPCGLSLNLLKFHIPLLYSMSSQVPSDIHCLCNMQLQQAWEAGRLQGETHTKNPPVLVIFLPVLSVLPFWVHCKIYCILFWWFTSLHVSNNWKLCELRCILYLAYIVSHLSASLIEFYQCSIRAQVIFLKFQINILFCIWNCEF